MKKKLVFAVLLATIAASLLAGCGSGDTMARFSISIAGMMNSRAVSQTTILITRRWMQHMAKSEILM